MLKSFVEPDFEAEIFYFSGGLRRPEIQVPENYSQAEMVVNHHPALRVICGGVRPPEILVPEN